MGACGRVVVMIDFDGQILIPKGNPRDFAVIACDQFTADKEYWQNVQNSMPKDSALDLILPECYLDEGQDRLPRIKSACERMLANDRFTAVNGSVLVTRKTSYGRVRRGIVAAIDLDAYDYKEGSETPIRASERTIEERIPPRVAIREAIDIEIPHIMLLVDDPENLLIGSAVAASKQLLYHGEILGGGSVQGELIGDSAPLYAAVDTIMRQSLNRYGTELFALVGDGNHSLACAKYCRQKRKTKNNGKALVEIVNIYDEGLVFEPIHRLVDTDDPVMFMDSFKSVVKGEAKSFVYAPNPIAVNVPQGKIQAIKVIDKFLEVHTRHFGGSVEYVHGESALKATGCFGIEMRGICKNELFDYVVKNGALPRKTFSLGEAEEKRYYIEARKIN